MKTVVACLKTLAGVALVLILATVFLHPVHAEPSKAVLILVCSCGKPAFAILATPDGVRVEGIPQTTETSEACKSRKQHINYLVVLRTEDYTKDQCPVLI